MARWFDNKYISRAELYEAIASYQAQIAMLEQQLRERQAQIDAYIIKEMMSFGEYHRDREVRRVKGAPVAEYGENIVSFEAARPFLSSSQNQRTPKR